jgi:hypothetical protein
MNSVELESYVCSKFCSLCDWLREWLTEGPSICIWHLVTMYSKISVMTCIKDWMWTMDMSSWTCFSWYSNFNYSFSLLSFWHSSSMTWNLVMTFSNRLIWSTDVFFICSFSDLNVPMTSSYSWTLPFDTLTYDCISVIFDCNCRFESLRP